MPTRTITCLITAACCSAPPADAAARLPAAGGPERLTLEVEAETPHLSGLFDAVLVVRPSPPAVRLQLLPDLGPPILDVAATPRAVVCYQQGVGTNVWRGAAGDPPPGLGLLFGLTLLEQHAALTAARIRCWDPTDPPRLALDGVFPGLRVDDAVLGPQGIVARRFRYGPIAWRDALRADGGEVVGPGVRIRAKVRAREAAPDVTDADFALDDGTGR